MDERGTIDGGRAAGGPDVAPEDDAPGTGHPRIGRQVGLGHVVVDRLSTVAADPGQDAGPDAPPTPRDVTTASEGSFPASDPPGFTGTQVADQR